MFYGVCGGPDVADKAAEAGFDFVEMTVGGLLKPNEGENAFRQALELVKNAPIPCRAVNCFVPGDLKITGPTADLKALESYVSVALRRARDAGVYVIVFGSGGARQIPDGFDPARAREQIVAFCRMMGPIAARFGVVVAVEPLSKRECNVLTSVGEAAALVRDVNHPAIRLLVDAYHWGRDGDSAADIVEAGPLFRHVHVATLANRLAPGMEEDDLAPFFQALRKAGYDGRVSVEARLPDTVEDLARSLALMKSLAAG